MTSLLNASKAEHKTGHSAASTVLCEESMSLSNKTSNEKRFL